MSKNFSDIGAKYQISGLVTSLLWTALKEAEWSLTTYTQTDTDIEVVIFSILYSILSLQNVKNNDLLPIPTSPCLSHVCKQLFEPI